MTRSLSPAQLATAIASELADPGRVQVPDAARPWWPQSLARGAPGVALLHIHRARLGLGSWPTARTWIRFITREPVITGPASGLFYGAPALACVLASTGTQAGPWLRALEILDQAVAAEAIGRAEEANARIDGGQLPTLAEFDVIRGLTGLGACLLRRDPDGTALRAVLDYLARLTESLTWHGISVPGWWTPAGPSGQPDADFEGGHGNLGVAHGIAGPLALLACAARRGITASHHFTTIRTLHSWLEQWQVPAPTGTGWPFWITAVQLRAGQPGPAWPQRLGWCYGTVGITRALQLAAKAVGDINRQHAAEQALIQGLSDPASQAVTTSLSLCHGRAGLAVIAAAAAVDATTPATAARLHAIADDLRVMPPDFPAVRGALGYEPGLLDGIAGIALALTSVTQAEAHTGWDTCMLIT